MLGLAHVSEAAVDVLCVVDISQMVARINLFGLLIPTANRNCDYDQLRRDGQEIDDEQRKTCAQFLLLNIINADLFLGVLTDSLTQCSGSLNIPANCATNIFSIVGTVTLIAQAGFQIEYSCVEQEDNLTKLVAEKKAEVQKAKTDVERDVRKFLNDRGFDVALLPPAPAVAKNRVYEEGLCAGLAGRAGPHLCHHPLRCDLRLDLFSHRGGVEPHRRLPPGLVRAAHGGLQRCCCAGQRGRCLPHGAEPLGPRTVACEG